MEQFTNMQTASSAEVLHELIRLGVATYSTKKIGCCYRGVVNLPGDSHSYYFKHDKPLSSTLSKKLSNPKYRKMPENARQKIVRNTLTNAYKTSEAITKIKKIYDGIRQRRVKKV